MLIDIQRDSLEPASSAHLQGPHPVEFPSSLTWTIAATWPRALLLTPIHSLRATRGLIGTKVGPSRSCSKPSWGAPLI